MYIGTFDPSLPPCVCVVSFFFFTSTLAESCSLPTLFVLFLSLFMVNKSCLASSLAVTVDGHGCFHS